MGCIAHRLLLCGVLWGVAPVVVLGSGVMAGFPPTSDSQVTKANYLYPPFNRWAFRNASAPLHTLMVPRGGPIYAFQRDESRLSDYRTAEGDRLTSLFARNYADSILVLKGETLLMEEYFDGASQTDHHLWFSMTKSLVSALFGKYVAAGRINLGESPTEIIPSLEGTAFDRVTVQHVLDHATALAFKENYTDPTSDFALYYGPALGMTYKPQAADVFPGPNVIYGVYDFLTEFIKPDESITPGEQFAYNSANADLLGWLLVTMAQEPLNKLISEGIWQHIGAEHDAFIAVDRAYMPVATGGFNATLRDAARFAMMIRDRGKFDDQQVVPAAWLDAHLKLSQRDIDNMSLNPVYKTMPWLAYRNMWWILDAEAEEFCAVGIHGQVIYINRSADVVIVWYSSQPDASAAASPHFLPKLSAARELAQSLKTQGG
jgi:CubicO group peptidase (beta-lactamase class C family)